MAFAVAGFLYARVVLRKVLLPCYAYGVERKNMENSEIEDALHASNATLMNRTFRITDAEWAALGKKAAQHGVTKTEAVRMLVIGFNQGKVKLPKKVVSYQWKGGGDGNADGARS